MRSPITRCNIPEMTRDGMHYYYIGDLIIEKLGLEEWIKGADVGNGSVRNEERESKDTCYSTETK